MSDQQLIQLHLSGNQHAFNRLVKEHHEPIFHFICKSVPDHADASDLCQKVFIKCYRGLKDLKDQQKFKSWLFSIARNQISDHWRSQSTHVTPVEPEYLNNITDYNATPEQYYDKQYRQELIHKALDLLPVSQKKVLQLKVLNGMKFTEIAQATGTSPNTVKSRCYYGLTALRKIFHKWNIQEIYDEM